MATSDDMNYALRRFGKDPMAYATDRYAPVAREAATPDTPIERSWLEKTGESVFQRARGTDDLVASVGNLLIGDNESALKRIEAWDANEQKAREMGPDAQEFSDITDLQSGASVFGYQVAKMIPDLALGGLAGGIVKSGVKKAATEAVAGSLTRKMLADPAVQLAEKKAQDTAVRELRKTAAYKAIGNRVEERAAKKAARETTSDQFVAGIENTAKTAAANSATVRNAQLAGFAGGATVGSLPGQLQEQGQFIKDNVDTLTPEDTLTLLAGSTLAASTDFLPMLGFMSRFSKKGVDAARAVDSFGKRLLKETAKGFAAEGGQEAVQAFITRGSQKFVDDNIQMFSDEALQDYAMNFLAGGFIGGGIGAAGEVGTTGARKATDMFREGVQKFDAWRSSRQQPSVNAAAPGSNVPSAIAAAQASGRTINPVAQKAMESGASDIFSARVRDAEITGMASEAEQLVRGYFNGQNEPLFKIDSTMRSISSDPFVATVSGFALEGIPRTITTPDKRTIVNPDLQTYLPGMQAIAKALRNGLNSDTVTDADMMQIESLRDAVPDPKRIDSLLGLAATRPTLNAAMIAAIDARIEASRQEKADATGQMDLQLRDDGSASVVLPDTREDPSAVAPVVDALADPNDAGDAETDYQVGRNIVSARSVGKENTPAQRADAVASVFGGKNPRAPEKVFFSDDFGDVTQRVLAELPDPAATQDELANLEDLLSALNNAPPADKQKLQNTINRLVKRPELQALYAAVKDRAQRDADAAAADALTDGTGILFEKNAAKPGAYFERVKTENGALYAPNKDDTAAVDLGILYRRWRQLDGEQDAQDPRAQLTAAIGAALSMPELNLDPARIPWGKTLRFKDGEVVKMPFKKDLVWAQKQFAKLSPAEQAAERQRRQRILALIPPRQGNTDPLDTPETMAGDDPFGENAGMADLATPGSEPGTVVRELEQPTSGTGLVADAPGTKANLNVSKKALKLRSAVENDAPFAVFGEEFLALGVPDAKMIRREGVWLRFYSEIGGTNVIASMPEGEFAEKAPTIFAAMQNTKDADGTPVSSRPAQFGNKYGIFLMPDKIYTQADIDAFTMNLLAAELEASRPEIDDRSFNVELRKITELSDEALDAAFERAILGDFDPRMRVSEEGNATFKKEYVREDENSTDIPRLQAAANQSRAAVGAARRAAAKKNLSAEQKAAANAEVDAALSRLENSVAALKEALSTDELADTNRVAMRGNGKPAPSLPKKRFNRDDFQDLVWNALTLKASAATRVRNDELTTTPVRMARIEASRNARLAGRPGARLLRKRQVPGAPVDSTDTAMADAMKKAQAEKAAADADANRARAAALKAQKRVKQPAPQPQPTALDARAAMRATRTAARGDSAVRDVTGQVEPAPETTAAADAAYAAANPAPAAPAAPTGKKVGFKLTPRGQYTGKDQLKASKATAYIGRGSAASSTNAYAIDAKAQGIPVNSGKYTSDDVVFVSAEGARASRVAVDATEVLKAVAAGATIITDSATTGRNRPFNVGERETAQILTKAGYAENNGVWTPAAAAKPGVKRTAIVPAPIVRAFIAANPTAPRNDSNAIWDWYEKNQPNQSGAQDFTPGVGTVKELTTKIRAALTARFSGAVVDVLEANGMLNFVSGEQAAKMYPGVENSMAFAIQGQVYFIVDKAPADSAELIGVMVHEAVHAWLPSMVGRKEFKRLTENHLNTMIARMAALPGSERMTYKQLAEHPVWGLYGLQRMRGRLYTKDADGNIVPAKDATQAADEALAYQVQYDRAKFEKLPWLQKLITRVANAFRMALWKYRMNAPAENRAALDAMYDNPEFLQHLAAQSVYEMAQRLSSGTKPETIVEEAVSMREDTLWYSADNIASEMSAAAAEAKASAAPGDIPTGKSGKSSAGTAPSLPGGSTGSPAAAKLAADALAGKTDYPLHLWQRDDFTALVNKHLTPEHRKALYDLAHNQFASVWAKSKSPMMQAAWDHMNATGAEGYEATLYYLLQAHAKGELVMDANEQKLLNAVTLGRRQLGLITGQDLAMQILADMKDGSLLAGVVKADPYQPERKLMRVNTKLAKLGSYVELATRRARMLFSNFMFNDYDRAERSGVPAFIELVDALAPRSGKYMLVDPATGAPNHGVHMALSHENAKWLKALSDAVDGLTPEQQTRVLRELYYNQAAPRKDAKLSPEETKAFAAIRKTYEDLFEYAAADGVFDRVKNRRKNYTPLMFDINGNVAQHKADLRRVFMQKGGTGKSGYKYETLLDDLFVQLNKADPGKTQIHFTSLNEQEKTNFIDRMLESTFFDPADLLLDNQMGARFKFESPRVFQQIFELAKETGDTADLDVLIGTLEPSLEQHGVRYVEPLVSRVVEARLMPPARFNTLHQQMREQGASQDDLDAAERIYNAAFNRYKFPVLGPNGEKGSPTIAMLNRSLAVKMHNRSTLRTMQNIGAWQNLRLLPLALLSSLVDPGGLVIRSGGRFGPSLLAMKDGLQGLVDKDMQAALVAAAESIGYSADLHAAMALQDGLAAGARTPFARRVNSWIFKVNMMESWTRQTRLMAVQGANDFLVHHQRMYREGTAKQKATALRYFKELGLQPDDVRIGVHGDGPLKGRPMVLVYSPAQAANANKDQLAADARVKAAMVKWVDEAILRPNNNQSPTWHKDPFTKLITQYKAFSYSIYEQLSRRALREISEGNWGVLSAALVYLPVALMAELLRELIQWGPDGNPQRAQWDGVDYAQHAVVKTGLLGPTFDFQHGLVGDVERGGVIGRSFAGPSVGAALDVGAAATGNKNVGTVVESQMPLSALWKNWNNGPSAAGGGSRDPVAAAVPSN